MLDKGALETLKKDAIAVLKENDMGSATKPAPRLYPHQWNWDSAFIAIGLSHVDEERAQKEILSLMRGQWSNGMIPHIIFNSSYVDYHPGPAFWDTSICPEAPRDVQTSGITQPPVLASAVYEMFTNSKDKKRALEFLRRIFPKLKKYHRFFFSHRDPNGEGLAYVIHPWESGLDDSPRWDELLEQMKMEWIPAKFKRAHTGLVPDNQRPSDKEHDKYVYLVELFRKGRYNPDCIRDKSSFIIQPILFNSLMCASLSSLGRIGDTLGEDTSEIGEWTLRTKNAINSKLWDEHRRMYGDYDLKNDRLICKNTIANFAPLYAGLPSSGVAELMVHTLTSPTEYWPENGYPLCSVSMTEPEFNPIRYWRGPVWININWLMIKGLKNYGYHKEAMDLAEKTMELVLKGGYYEYFNPYTGEGCGTSNLSWSASLIIDLIEACDKGGHN